MQILWTIKTCIKHNKFKKGTTLFGLKNIWLLLLSEYKFYNNLNYNTKFGVFQQYHFYFSNIWCHNLDLFLMIIVFPCVSQFDLLPLKRSFTLWNHFATTKYVFMSFPFSKPLPLWVLLFLLRRQVFNIFGWWCCYSLGKVRQGCVFVLMTARHGKVSPVIVVLWFTNVGASSRSHNCVGEGLLKYENCSEGIKFQVMASLACTSMLILQARPEKMLI